MSAPPSGAVRQRLVDGWLAAFFWLSGAAPWALLALRPVFTRAAWACAPGMRARTRANAAHLLGPGSSPAERTAMARAVVGNFFDAVVDFGRNRRTPVPRLLDRLDSVVGEERYAAARACGRGAILATAHLGPFETAMAMVAGRERRVHVVFQRDKSALFERLRTEQHARLGVSEAPVDDGLATWYRLRDALGNDEVVLMQADRVMPGQPGVEVRFLGGTVRLPSGPVKLARLTGAPIIPVFALRTAGGRVRLIIEEPIWADEIPADGSVAGDVRGPDPALLRLAAVLEGYVRSHPEQWLCLHAVWCNDAPQGPAPTPAAAAP